MNKFLIAVADVLEVEKVGQETNFRATPGWCSLKAFGLLVMLENDWGAPLTIARFQELVTVKDLYREAFLALAARVFGVNRAELSGNTKYGELSAWDSVAHLRLAMEAEEKFDLSYPLECIPALATLDDFLV